MKRLVGCVALAQFVPCQFARLKRDAPDSDPEEDAVRGFASMLEIQGAMG